jgi:hypothetical protein
MVRYIVQACLVAASPKHPETLHYTDDDVFMVAGKIIIRRSLFRPAML